MWLRVTVLVRTDRNRLVRVLCVPRQCRCSGRKQLLLWTSIVCTLGLWLTVLVSPCETDSIILPLWALCGLTVLGLLLLRLGLTVTAISCLLLIGVDGVWIMCGVVGVPVLIGARLMIS